jgi:GT2 family glycosyltransferase
VSTRIAAVIPNWNGAPRLEKALGSLAAQSRKPDRVIVVDNGSTDRSRECAQSRGADVIALDRNYGFAAAVNRGLDAVAEELVAVVNNDVTFERDWLERLLHGLGAAPFAAGRMLRASDPAKMDGSFDLICRGACAWRAGASRQDGDLWRQPRGIGLAPFTAVLFRREIFSRIGYLDVAFESYLEDVDFGIRCASEGYTGVYVPEAVAYHEGSATLGEWNARTVRYISRNQLLLVAKHYSPEMLRRCGWQIATAHLLWGILAVRHGQGLAWLSGKVDGLRNYRSARRNMSADTAVKLQRFLEESERELFSLQREGGFDWYWRLYFALT